MATAESQAFRRQFSILINAIDDPLSIAVEAYSRCLVSKDVRDKMLISSLTTKEKAVLLLTSVESNISTNQQSFHEFVRVLKTQTNLVQTAENLQVEYWKYRGEQVSTTTNLESPMPTLSQPPVKRIHLDDSQVQSQGLVPHSGTSQVGGQFVGAVNPLQQLTSGKQSVVTPCQQSPMPTASQPEPKRIHLDDSQVKSQGAAYHNYCSNVCAVYQRTTLQKEDCWPPMQKVTFINLALLKSDKLTLSDDYTLMTIQRSADDIVSKKKKIGYNELFSHLDSGVRILVEGRPGCGKTTLMNKVSVDWANKKILKDISLLLLVPLRRFRNKPEVKLADILQLYDTGHLGHAVGEEVSNSGGKGVCIVFDGIDEYPHSLSPGNFILEVLAGRILPNSVVTASSRPAAAHGIRQYATQRVEVLGFLRPEIQQYIQECYEGKDDKVKSLSTYLQRHPNIRHMCYLPLHLAMVVYLNDNLETGSLPHTETDIYNKFMLHTLLLNMRKLGITCSKLNDIKQLPSGTLEIFWNICRLAYIATVQSEQIFAKDEIQEHIGSREFRLTSLGLLTEDRLLVEQGLEETYSFAHLTFQEFLAAYHLTELPDAEQLKAAEEHGGDRHMRVMWKFYCGLTKLSGDVATSVLHVLLQQDEMDPLLLSHSIHESQNKIACCELISSMSGELCISDEVLTPVDSVAVAYCMQNALYTLTKVGFQSCYLGDEELQVLTSECSHPLVNVKCLRLKKTLIRKKVVTAFAAFLGKFPNVEVLEFKFTKCSQLPSGEALIAQLTSLNSLKYLITDFTVIRSGGGVLQLLNTISALEMIRCDGSTINLEVSKELGKVASARGASFSDADVQAIAELLKLCPRAQKICLGYNNLGDKGVSNLASVLKECQELKELNLDSNNLGKEGIVALTAALQECKQLQVLSLDSNNLGKEGIVALTAALQECKQLQVLSLDSNNLGKEGTIALTAALQECKQLQVLDLGWNNIQDASCAALSAALQECKELQKLDLRWNNLTDASVEPLTELIKTSKSLKTLWLSCNNFTAEGEKQLKVAAEERNIYADVYT